MSVLAAGALVVGLICGLAPLAQAVRIRVNRSSADVSLVWLSLYGCGAVVWLLYGVAESSVPLIASQTVALSSVLAALVLAVRARRVVRREHRAGPRATTTAAGQGHRRGRTRRALAVRHRRPLPGRRSHHDST